MPKKRIPSYLKRWLWWAEGRKEKYWYGKEKRKRPKVKTEEEKRGRR